MLTTPSAAKRQKSEIGRDRLRIEREEAALIWHPQAQGDAIEQRPDATPLAVLGIELRTFAR
ncbi:hypothetical protein [Bradyrhizobium sp. DASA03120]|uniref:hypothetical protein n=1 Tax=Bradyrhizobium sp. SMVTL-02 TaxID=3395917 RepID=UPI003F6F3FF2